jgi:signal transduction histidine kinase
VNSPTWQGISASISRASSELEPGQVRIVDECGSLEIFADPLLVKVVYNLIDNALRHGGSVSTIRIRYQNADRDLTWIIEDDGDGVQVKDKENIFSKGFGKNTGFGLFLVREILAITGMSIAETGFPGNGARFGIHVPYGHYRFADKL